MMKRLIIVLGILSVLTIPSNAAYLKNIPKTIIQPDGTIIECFVSGDEFHNWLHDENNYTIIQGQDGYYYYADKIGDQIVPSQYIVGQAMIKSTSIQPGINISPEKWKQKRHNKLFMAPLKSFRSKEMAADLNINQLCIYIRFNDDSEWTKDTSTYYDWLNGESPTSTSMFNFFNTVSYNNVEVRSHFYPKSSTATVVSYQDYRPRSYFEPYNETTNPNGYDPDEENVTSENGSARREWDLLERALEYFNNNYTIPAGTDLDWDNDGLIDNIVFFIKGEAGEWSELLWPHNWALYNREIYINDIRVYNYNFQIESITDQIGVGVLSHEMAHAIGFHDLYHYSEESTFDPVGIWDLMGTTTSNPQSFGAYTKFKYGGWISSIPEITTANTYELNPIDSVSNNSFKIVSPYSTSEFFVLEYRKNTGLFDVSLPGNGLLVYRINNTVGPGNSNGPPDEVYLYRPGGSITNNGNLNQAFFSLSSGRVSIDNTSDPTPFLNDGGFGGLYISEISDADEKISFRVDFYPDVLYADFTPAQEQDIFAWETIDFKDVSRGGPETWEWTFEGGIPSSYTGQDPPPIQYRNTGTFDVILEISKGSEILIETRENFVTVAEVPGTNPPRNLAAELAHNNPSNVVLNWLVPEITMETITIRWDDGQDSKQGIGFGSYSYIFEMLSVWEPSDLLPYDNWYITHINFFPTTSTSYPTVNNYSLKIYTGPDFGNLVYTQSIPENDITFSEWNQIVLTTPFKIDATSKLYFGVNHNSGTNPSGYPFGVDHGPAVEGGKGDFFYVHGEGGGYGNLSDFVLDYNWSLSASITNSEPILQQGYNIYRNHEKVNTSLVTGTTFTDMGLTEGSYDYFVTAVYPAGESIASNIFTIDVFTTDVEKPELFIYPNPVNDKLYFKLKEPTTEPLIIHIYNQLGKIVYTEEISTPLEINTISVVNIPLGIYNIVVYSDIKTYYGKFIVIK